MEWLDLSEHGLSLKLFKTKKAHYLIVQGENVDAFKAEANVMGYKLQKKYDKDGREVAPDAMAKQLNAGKAMGPNMSLHIRAFPKAKKVAYDPAIHLVDMTAARPAALPSHSDDQSADSASGSPSDRNAAIHLGTNRQGFEVFKDAGGRFVRDNRGDTTVEGSISPPNPGMFLRGSDEAAIDSCAEALVRLADRKRVFRLDEFKKFAAIVFDKDAATDEDMATLRLAVTRAIPRLLATRSNKTSQDLFVISGHISDNLQFLRGAGVAPLSLPAPMGVATQRVLGTEASLRGKKVAILADEPAMFSSNISKSATVGFDAVDAVNADFLVLEMKADRGQSDARGFAFTRRDYASAIRALDSKADDGVSVIVLEAPQTADERVEFETLRQSIAASHAFHADARVNSALWMGQTASSEPKIMFAIGDRLAEDTSEATPPGYRDIDDWAQLWSWTAEVVSQRQRAALRVDAGNDGVSGVSFRAAEAERNEFQTPYVSASAVGAPKTMVPRNLDGATRDALETVVRKYGSVDALVMREYGYKRDEIGEIFSPEQIDALALHVYAEDRGRDFLVADEMGVGKGRTLAAVMRRSVLKGQKVVFLTERETNLSDIWRDIVATRSNEILKPYLLNTDGKVIDRETRDVVLAGPSSTESEKLVATMAFPAGANLLLSTYSQHNREVDWKWETDETAGEDTLASDVVLRTIKDYRKEVSKGKKYPAAKSLYLAAIMDANIKIVGDESHNATGDSNISENLTVAVDRSAAATWSSATWAADASRVSFYAGLFPDELSVPELSAMMVKGGETFQEVLSAMLVADGVMIRREFDLSNLTFETITDTARFERNRDYMDAVAPVIAELSALSSEVDRRVEETNRRRRAPRDEPNQAADKVAEVNGNSVYRVSRASFGQPLYVISRLFVAALRVDAVVESALDCLENGEKPVILVDNTLQELFEEIAAAGVDTEGAVVDFRALMSRVLRKMVTTSVYDQERDETFVHDISKNDPKMGAMVARIQRMIADMPSISVSVIDDVKRRIREAGWTIDEITGRTLQLHNGKVMRRPIANPTEIKNDFNDGILDVVMINTGGTTGIDLHASSTFKDQRRRVLHELQPPMDVVKKTQAHGRVNRYDQVSYPKIRRFQTGLPAEMRLDAMENAKLRRLSANTRSNRDSATLMRDIPDLINAIGDIVCSRYAEQRPDLMRRLGLKPSQVIAAGKGNSSIEKAAGKSLTKDVTLGKTKDTEAARSFVVADGKRTANEILARLIMLPVDMQTKVCNELTAEYFAAVEELEARGETPLRTNELQGIVHERSRKIMDGAETEDADSVFHQPLYVVSAALERTADPIKSDDILQRIELGEMASSRNQACIDRINADMEDILSQYLPTGAVSVEHALAYGNKDIVERKARLDRLVLSLGEIRPGRDISFTFDGEVVKGIVTQVEYPNRGYEGVTGLYGIEFAVPGDLKYRSLRLETLLRDKAFAIGPGLEVANYDEVLKRFDDAVVTKLSTVRLLTNNIFRAVQLNVGHGLGRLVAYTAADGTRHRGIAVSNRHRNLEAIPVEINSAGMAYDAVKAGFELVGDGALSDKVFSVKPIENLRVEVRLPSRTSRKYGHVYDSRILLNLLAAADVKSKPIVILTHEEFRSVAEEFQKVGARLWMTPLARDWANKRLAGVLAPPQDEVDQDDDENDNVRAVGMRR